MLKFRILIALLVLFFLMNSVNGATVYGTIYELSLKKLNNARVEINTSPKQFLVAQNGTYSFNVPNGMYTIKSQLVQKNSVIASVQENITIKLDGNYVLDLILFPDVEEGVEDIGIDVNGNIIDTDKKQSSILVYSISILVFFVIIITIFLYKIRKQRSEIKTDEDKKEEQHDNLEHIIKFIKDEGGRATQKDIRKQIPLSEAKISLMIAELEHKGFIEKIKKGRGNIVILKKR